MPSARSPKRVIRVVREWEAAPNPTMKRILAAIAALPRDTVITTRGLALRSGVSYGTMRQYAPLPQLSPYRHTRGAQGHYWGKPATLRQIHHETNPPCPRTDG